MTILRSFFSTMDSFSLSKSTTTPRLRTAIVKFDYESSDSNEFSVLAKEVRCSVIHGWQSVFFSRLILDSQYSRKSKWRFRMDNDWKISVERTWTNSTKLFTIRVILLPLPICRSPFCFVIESFCSSSTYWNKYMQEKMSLIKERRFLVTFWSMRTTFFGWDIVRRKT